VSDGAQVHVRRRRRAWRAAALAALLTATLSSCTAPARTEGQFDAKASITVSDSVSQLATLQLLVGTVRDDRMPAPTAQVTSVDAVDDLASVRRTFAAVRPPSAASAAQKRELQGALEKAEAVADRAHDAVVSRDAAALRRSESELAAAIDALNQQDPG
jgi:hypothetical protein